MAEKQLNKILLRLRAVDKTVERLRVNKIDVYPESKGIRFTIICENTIDEQMQAKLLDVLNNSLPTTFLKISLEVKKIKADEELVKREIFDYLKNNCKSVAHSVERDDIRVFIPQISCEKGDLSPVEAEPIIKFFIAVDGEMVSQFESHGTLKEIEGYLGRTFCNDFRGEAVEINRPVDYSILQEKPVQIDYYTYRTVQVSDIVKLDDVIGTNKAIYIDDVRGVMDSVLLCGEILSVRERATAAGKPFYLIEFSDRSGKIVGTYFNKKATEDKIRRLKEGDGIFIQGSVDYYRDRLSLTIKKINYCTFPKDFKPERRASKRAPLEYTHIIPKRMVEYSQEDIFTKRTPPPQCLMGKTFVVFDFETTGTDVMSDMVTEVGAVKVVDGVITEKFGALINPQRKISEKITELTGITNEMVANKPPFSQVCADIYKFFEGAILVAHNIDFDYKFLKRLSEPSEYYYYNEGIDTVTLAREVLPRLSNHKLNTVCEHFGIEFNHHRAEDDCYATAQMFIKLVEMKGKLPETV